MKNKPHLEYIFGKGRKTVLVEIEGNKFVEVAKDVGLEFSKVVSPEIQQLEILKSVKGSGYEVSELVASQLQGAKLARLVEESVGQSDICVA